MDFVIFKWKQVEFAGKRDFTFLVRKRKEGRRIEWNPFGDA
jgi:hypothetical protein